MKNLNIVKKALVKLPKDQQFDGIIAVQMVEFSFNYFGNKVTEMLDTKIMEDGRQIVIDGNGFIPAGYEI